MKDDARPGECAIASQLMFSVERLYNVLDIIIESRAIMMSTDAREQARLELNLAKEDFSKAFSLSRISRGLPP